MASGQAIKAGEAYVSLSTRNQQLISGLRAAAARVQAFGAVVSRVGRGVFGLGALLGTPLVLAAKAFADMGSEVLDMSQRTGLAVDALTELSYAAEQSGATVGDLETAVRNMSRTVRSGGVSLDERLEQIADELVAIDDPAKRAAQAVAIFGRSGTRLLPLFSQGSAGVRELREEARRLGLSMSHEDASNAERFGDSLSRLWAVLRRTLFGIGSAIAPQLERLADWLSEAGAAVMQWVRDNKELIVIVGGVVAGLTAVGLALMILGPAISAIGVAISIVTAAFAALTAVVGFAVSAITAMLSPLGLVLLSLDLLRGYLVASAVQSTNTFGTLGAGFREIGATAMTTWEGIRAAMSSGDLETAARIGLLGVETAWMQFVETLRRAWQDFADFFVDVWDQASSDIAENITPGGGGWGDIFGLAGIQRPVGIEALTGQPVQTEGERVRAQIRAETERLRIARAARNEEARREAQARINAQRQQLDSEVKIAQLFASRDAARRAKLDIWRELGRGITKPKAIGGRVGISPAVQASSSLGMAFAGRIQERTARASEETARNTRRIAIQMGAGGLDVI